MMKFLSRLHNTPTSSYLMRRRRRRILIGALALVALVGAGLFLTLVSNGVLLGGRSGTQAVSKSQILRDWEAKAWDKVLAESTSSLQARPLDDFYLAFSGLAAFYKGSELPDGEERAALMDRAVISLRKTLVVASRSGTRKVPRAELEYVLGKACYFKGQAYLDETARWLEASIKDGYLAEDSREYLAVAYAGLGEKEKALANFDAALARKKSDLLLIAAGKAYLDAGKDARAESLLLEALASSGDVLAREKCRFLLASIYDGRGEGQKAQAQVELVISENADSAEAHYRLGLIYQKAGDPIKARSEWRRAVSIDPMHAAARQKLTEKL